LIITAVILYLLSSTICLLFAGRYLFIKRLLPYYAAALGKTWEELEPPLQWIIRGMQTVIGGGLLAVGVTGALLALFLVKPHTAAFAALVPVPYLLFGVAALYAAMRTKRHTNAKTPVIPSIVGIVTVVVAYLLSTFPA